MTRTLTTQVETVERRPKATARRRARMTAKRRGAPAAAKHRSPRHGRRIAESLRLPRELRKRYDANIDFRVLHKEPLSSLLTPHIDPISFTNIQILKYRVEKGSWYKKKRKTTSADYFHRPSVNYTWLPLRLSKHLITKFRDFTQLNGWRTDEVNQRVNLIQAR